MGRFLEAFIPLFVAIDPLGMVPLFLAITDRLPETRRRAVSIEATLAAFAIAVLFMLLGQSIFRVLHITEPDFRIAGGIILLVLAVLDLLMSGKPAVHESEMVGLVPLAMPLIAGPGTLTTVLVLAETVGLPLTAIALLVNFAILLLVLLGAGRIARVVGVNALGAFSKLVMVLLAAIAVNFIRTGVEQIIAAR